MQRGSPQFTPRQLLDAGRRAEAEGKLDHAMQLYRHLADHYANTAEAGEARNGLGRMAGGNGQQVWALNGAAAMPPPLAVAPRTLGPHPHTRARTVAKEHHYRTGRVLATVVSFAGWLIVAAGAAMAVVMLAADPMLLQRGVPYAASLGPAGGVAAAVALCFIGLAAVFWGQMASALFDQANAIRELVAIERARRHGQD